MTTIAEENRKTLRKSLSVQCSFQESTEGPADINTTNVASDYNGLANIDSGLLPSTLMDLAGSGFLNDGNAAPMQTDTDSNRNGYVSEETAKADGTFANPPGLTITADQTWDKITLQVRGQYGTSEILQIEPVWVGGQTTVYIDKWIPGERVYIIGVFLGLAWVWNNESLLSVTADLHGVGTELGGELEVSSIEIQAYEQTDYTDVIGRIPRGAPIYYTAGYDGDLSELRRFYLSEPVTWNNSVLTIKGQDASYLLDDVEVPSYANFHAGETSTRYTIQQRLESALDTIDYEKVGSFPDIRIISPGGDGFDVRYDRKPARAVISEHVDLFRNVEKLRITYVDAGRPTIYYGGNGARWTIYADEISEFNATAEMRKNALKITLPDYYEFYNTSIEQVDATAGKYYFVDLDPPVPTSNVWISPTPTSSEQINCERFKFRAAETTQYTVYGYQALENIEPGNDPYVASIGGSGEPFEFGFIYPNYVTTDNYQLTKRAVADLLSRSNITYEFTYRGNPKIQPRDVLEVEVATWVTEQEVTSGLYPVENLYPAEDLYPFATYKPVRRMKKEWVPMTVDSITLEHTDGGGFSSKITARRGVV